MTEEKLINARNVKNVLQPTIPIKKSGHNYQISCPLDAKCMIDDSHARVKGTTKRTKWGVHYSF